MLEFNNSCSKVRPQKQYGKDDMARNNGFADDNKTKRQKVKFKKQKRTQQQQLKEVVGVLVSHWVNPNNKKLIAKNVGTAFAVTKSLLLTCTHNIYASCYEKHCDQIVFFPGAECGLNLNSEKGFPGRPIIIKPQYKGIAFQVKPIKQELAIISLDTPLEHIPQDLYPTIGNFTAIRTHIPPHHLLPNRQPFHHAQVRIMGYPILNKYQMLFNPLPHCKNGFFNKNGQVISYPIHNNEEVEIRYTIPTMKGLSGSPIVTEKEQGIVVVGIHTHQGQKAGYNSGLYFNKAILETIFRVNKKAIQGRKDIGEIKFDKFCKDIQIVNQVEDFLVAQLYQVDNQIFQPKNTKDPQVIQTRKESKEKFPRQKGKGKMPSPQDQSINQKELKQMLLKQSRAGVRQIKKSRKKEQVHNLKDFQGMQKAQERKEMPSPQEIMKNQIKLKQVLKSSNKKGHSFKRMARIVHQQVQFLTPSRKAHKFLSLTTLLIQIRPNHSLPSIALSSEGFPSRVQSLSTSRRRISEGNRKTKGLEKYD